jgi:hypothetical protein
VFIRLRNVEDSGGCGGIRMVRAACRTLAPAQSALRLTYVAEVHLHVRQCISWL